MEYKPHAYQEKAINFIVSHPIAALFIDMGLGKTSITLYAIMFLLQKKKILKKKEGKLSIMQKKHAYKSVSV